MFFRIKMKHATYKFKLLHARVFVKFLIKLRALFSLIFLYYNIYYIHVNMNN